jgi:hypothetical protein
MSNWQELAVVFHALALAVLGSVLLWSVSTAFVRWAERHGRRLPPPTRHERPTGESRASAPPRRQPLATGLSR